MTSQLQILIADGLHFMLMRRFSEVARLAFGHRE